MTQRRVVFCERPIDSFRPIAGPEWQCNLSIKEKRLRVGAVHGGMATGRPASSEAKKSTVVDVADEESGTDGGSLRLGVALEAQIHVSLDEHLGVDGAVRAMTDSATFSQRRVFEDERTRLFAMTLGATLIQTRHGQAACRFHDVRAVRVMAIDTIHLAFEHRMMLRQMKLGAYFLMTLKAGFGVFARIDDELFPAPAADHGDVLAARAVAGLAAALARHVGNFRVQARMGAGGENTGNIGMAVEAGLIADVSGTLNLQWDHHGSVGGTGIKQQNQRSGTGGERRCGQVTEAIQLGIAHEWSSMGRVAICCYDCRACPFVPQKATAPTRSHISGNKTRYKAS
jgi:hypothetical protein